MKSTSDDELTEDQKADHDNISFKFIFLGMATGSVYSIVAHFFRCLIFIDINSLINILLSFYAIMLLVVIFFKKKITKLNKLNYSSRRKELMVENFFHGIASYILFYSIIKAFFTR